MPLTTQVPKTPTKPAVLRATADLIALGYTRDDVMAAAKISRATYYRRLAEIEQVRSGRRRTGE